MRERERERERERGRYVFCKQHVVISRETYLFKTRESSKRDVPWTASQHSTNNTVPTDRHRAPRPSPEEISREFSQQTDFARAHSKCVERGDIQSCIDWQSVAADHPRCRFLRFFFPVLYAK